MAHNWKLPVPFREKVCQPLIWSIISHFHPLTGSEMYYYQFRGGLHVNLFTQGHCLTDGLAAHTWEEHLSVLVEQTKNWGLKMVPLKVRNWHVMWSLKVIYKIFSALNIWEFTDHYECCQYSKLFALQLSASVLIEREIAQLCPTLCNPVDCSPPGSSIHGILQARILEWVAISFSKGSFWPRDRTQVSRIAGRCFNLCAH